MRRIGADDAFILLLIAALALNLWDSANTFASYSASEIWQHLGEFHGWLWLRVGCAVLNLLVAGAFCKFLVRHGVVRGV